ncbi:uncharacterized protein Z520_09477 [Fonsecaea multimorphosa CBS 102226]|uniref:SAM-dependent MTase RsmB/NOP-type domain-containing protein n=1 Tax=Fonsecaea multimorphosa CBS 102226 TaxID=1442371 RepID=A0A0D2JN56_9EURO|nr:uncharacterized protein Z520_09477 [Fonsecaea multimorphosa CBS 102226]KIX94787.1 hypothetical protein Z520_09477 [Fonsecaea multimorphosa CBS 102226]OAL20368.1 hypothetical protein AYO22_08862 [Fonsecaea multimorphosa]
MSLYYDAATVLTTTAQEGSLKSRIYGNKLGLRSKPAHIYALISETAKYDQFIKEVVDNAGLLAQEQKLTPLLSLLLVHDHFFSKNGLAAPSAHPLRQAIDRNKTRLQAEFTKARLRRRCTTLDELRRSLLAESPRVYRSQPRWVRINTLKTSLAQELATTFEGYQSVATITEVTNAFATEKVLAIDRHVPNLVALPPEADVTKTQAYKAGELILQDKASCFPAYMLVGERESSPDIGDCIDACAAPGNKTSHLAALLAENGKTESKLFACERDSHRSKTLFSMMQKSGSEAVTVQPSCDFLTLSPRDVKYKRVTHLLLDPSCSGSGIVGREDVPSLTLPVDPRSEKTHPSTSQKTSRKRKREHDSNEAMNNTSEAEETKEVALDSTRLLKLSNLQTMIVEHALSFPAAVRVTYSTCSIHVEENEAVVSRVLQSAAAKEGRWRLLRREEQACGMRGWAHRGIAVTDGVASRLSALSEEDREACIRCHPGDDEGTMGFFVCCFVRSPLETTPQSTGEAGETQDGQESWEGFSD